MLLALKHPAQPLSKYIAKEYCRTLCRRIVTTLPGLLGEKGKFRQDKQVYLVFVSLSPRQPRQSSPPYVAL